eukprot:scaffold11321_cov141-Isochrysis_galbana.AAC.4
MRKRRLSSAAPSWRRTQPNAEPVLRSSVPSRAAALLTRSHLLAEVRRPAPQRPQQHAMQHSRRGLRRLLLST